MHGHLYFLMGVSGSGKGTLRKNLEKQDLDNLEFLKSYVTRDMRPGEVSGDIYHFIAEDDFKDAIQDDEFLEYAYVHQAGYYGTKKAEILEGIEAGKILMKEVEIIGLEKILTELPDFKENYTTIFLDVPEDVMRARNLERNPNTPEDELNKRVQSLKNEKEKAGKLCDYIIDATQTPEKVMQDVLDIMKI